MRQFEDDSQHCPDDGQRLRDFVDAADKLLGSVIDERFRIEEKIGEGGMGEVYRATQINVDRVVAVKVLRLALASSEQYVARFFREADIATSVQHPHFVTIYDFGQTPNQLLYIAMELLEGEPLGDLVKRERIELLDALTIGAQVCAALAAAHDRRIVHRDLKPDNIFLVNIAEGGMFAKVLDFGIAKNLDSADNVTRTGQLFGTPEYMSPEQCEGGGRVDGRSDLYALGCILYEIISGRSPFHRDSVIKTLMAQVNDDIRSFAELGIPVPRGVERIVLKLLAKKPGERYQSAIEARTDIVGEIDRLRQNSGEIQTYETVSAKIPCRKEGARTVSYGDLAHPLHLEGALASGPHAVGPDISTAVELQSTEPIVVPRSNATLPIVLVLLVAAAVAAGAWQLSQPPTVPGVPVASAATFGAAANKLSAAVEHGTSAASVSHTEALGRRQGSTVSVTAAGLAAGGNNPPVRKAPKGSRAPAAGNDAPIRSRSSMRNRLLRKQRALLRCYDRREDGDDAGSVRFQFDIAADGTLRSAKVSSKSLKSQAVLGCMQRVADAMRFHPAAVGGSFEKELDFKPGR